MIVRLSHVGQAVKSIEETLKVYSRLWNLRPVSQMSFPEEATASALIPIGHNFLELLQPTSNQGALARFLRERGEGLFHLSLVVEDIDREIQTLRHKGAQVAEAPPQPNLPYKRGWLHPRSTKGLLIELINEELIAQMTALPSSPSPQSPIIALTHLQHAVKSLEESLSLYDHYWGIKPILRLEDKQLKRAVVRLGKRNYLELAEPASSSSPVAKHIQKWGESLRACCFGVKDLAQVAKDLKSQGVQIAEEEASLLIPFPSLWVDPSFTCGLLIQLCPYQDIISFMESGSG